MRVISFLNSKGGTGKTTLSIAIATFLARCGFRVALVDCDPQGSIRNWYDENKCKFDVFEAGSDKDIYSIKKTLKQYQYVVIDGAAVAAAISAAAVMVSDVVLIPVSASPLDFAASGSVVQMLEAREALKPIKAGFVITKRVTNAKMTKTLRESIAETGLPVLRNGTAHRQSYIRSLMEGGTIFDSDDNQAKGEIELLGKEILEMLEAA